MFSSQFRSARNAHDNRWLPKFLLRAIQVFIALLGIAIETSVVGTQTGGEPYFGGVWIQYMIVWIITIVWAIANFIRLFVSVKPIHPGVIVGIDLIAWLLYGIVSISGLGAFITAVVLRQQCAHGGKTETSVGLLHYENNCEFPNASTYMAGLVFMAFGGIIIGIGHLYLFVRGCIETHRRRRAARNGPVMPAAANANFSYAGQKA